ncbi:hypothetical protein PR202_gb11766 [Eleusine coracana subsp. coracana]|uniref:Zinc finger PHD-type domain-containing protein n=1 Tax=Eleusine coracana subsp. coracana TaxID=191504 RepID=A0AAV5EP61_ELECO|nr:hypothetical protein PR202_gb11766 [Eleusine coracana subsp. coracana]
MKPAALGQLNTVCEVCGDIGFRHLLVCCNDCICSAVHQYCLDTVVFDASLAEWLCYECLQRRGEATCCRSLEEISSEKPYSPNDGRDKVFSCTSLGNTTTVQEGSADFIDTLSSYQHATRESSESSKRYTDCQADNPRHHGKAVEMDTTSSSSEESEEDIPSERTSLKSGVLQAPTSADFILSRTSYLSKKQKERVKAFIQETKPVITVFVAIMRKSNVQPPGPSLHHIVFHLLSGNSLSKSQKKIVEERVRAIQSEVPICVAVMKNNNVGVAQKWMLVSDVFLKLANDSSFLALHDGAMYLEEYIEKGNLVEEIAPTFQEKQDGAFPYSSLDHFRWSSGPSHHQVEFSPTSPQSLPE